MKTYLLRTVQADKLLNTWKLGRAESQIKGKDGVLRGFKIRTGNGHIHRGPRQCLKFEGFVLVILRALYLKQNIAANVDIFLQSKRKLPSIVVVCRPCSRKWRILVNIGDFEGSAFGVYLSVIRVLRSGKRRTLNLQNSLIGNFFALRKQTLPTQYPGEPP